MPVKGRTRFAVMAMSLLIGSACSGTGSGRMATASTPVATAALATPSQQASPPQTVSTPSASPSPTLVSLSCSTTAGPASAPLLLSRTLNNERILLTSLADAAHPSTLCTMSANAYDVKFISPTEIGYAINSSPDHPSEGTTLIQRVSLTDPRPVTLASLQGVVLDVAWSPDGSNFAYIASTYSPNLGSGAANQLWVKVGNAAPRALTPLIPLFGRGGSIDDETIVRFSYDGRYLLMVDTFVAGPAAASPDQAAFQVHSLSLIHI